MASFGFEAPTFSSIFFAPYIYMYPHVHFGGSRHLAKHYAWVTVAAYVPAPFFSSLDLVIPSLKISKASPRKNFSSLGLGHTRPEDFCGMYLPQKNRVPTTYARR